MAFWTNVYNILAVEAVLSDYPVQSINDAGSLFKKVWDKDVAVVAGKMRTLNEVEHEILRPMGDFRVHAAIVCASVSCPDLRTEAFYADQLDEQFDDQMRQFLGSKTKGAVLEGSTLYLSKIFDWFKGDFLVDGKSLVEALQPYMPAGIASAVSKSTKVRYLDYDWSLNDSARL